MPYKDVFSLDATSWSSLFGDNATVAGGIPAIGLAAYVDDMQRPTIAKSGRVIAHAETSTFCVPCSGPFQRRRCFYYSAVFRAPYTPQARGTGAKDSR